MINKDFFRVIDTEEKAYWLGFITADGWIEKGDNRLGIEISIKDKYHLEKFGKIFDREVKERHRFDKRTQKIYSNCFVRLNSSELVSDLKSYGLNNHKTETLNDYILSCINDAFIHHFVRGFFDGDGCIMHGSKNSNFHLCGTENFLTALKNLISSKCGIVIPQISFAKNLWSFSCSGNYRVGKFKEWIYQDATIFLTRKKNIFDSIPVYHKYQYIHYLEDKKLWRVLRTLKYSPEKKVSRAFKFEEDAVNFALENGLDIYRNEHRNFLDNSWKDKPKDLING